MPQVLGGRQRANARDPEAKARRAHQNAVGPQADERVTEPGAEDDPERGQGEVERGIQARQHQDVGDVQEKDRGQNRAEEGSRGTATQRRHPGGGDPCASRGDARNHRDERDAQRGGAEVTSSGHSPADRAHGKRSDEGDERAGKAALGALHDQQQQEAGQRKGRSDQESWREQA